MKGGMYVEDKITIISDFEDFKNEHKCEFCQAKKICDIMKNCEIVKELFNNDNFCDNLHVVLNNWKTES